MACVRIALISCDSPSLNALLYRSGTACNRGLEVRQVS